jgi:subtilisin family serine protease
MEVAMRQVGLALALLLVAGSAWAGDGTVARPAPGATLIKDQYIVHFTRGVEATAAATDLASLYGARVLHTYTHALNGAAYAMTENQAKAMSLHPQVTKVEQDTMFFINVTQSPATWGIDRVDQRNLPLSNSYTYDFTGAGVRAFIVDTGIRTTHTNFGGRASWGTDCTGEGQSDGNGHGTHVAGTVGSATYGIAKGVSLIAVKVCTAGGSCPNSAILCGVNYVTGQKNNNPSIPMVANMSLGGGVNTTLDNAVAGSVSAGIFYAVAAGNNNSNACNFSPARTPSAYTVGSTTSTDARSSFSNFGTCVDIFAPGSSITSTWRTSDTATNTISGTSMASPHVAGAGALVLHEHPTWTPAQVDAELDARATTGVISNVGSGSPNRLLFTLGGGPPPPPPPTCAVSETFESGSTGWVNDAASTCTTGAYVRANPTLVSNGGVTTQPGGSHGGSFSLFTATNSSAGVNDVDGGNCILRGPNWSVSAASTLSVWYFHGQRDQGGDAAGDFLRLEYSTNGGSTWNLLASRGDQTTTAAWTNATAQVSSGATVSLRVQCSDGTLTGDLIECGVDDVTICAN